MRISSSMVYDSGVRTINDQMSKMLHTQQMLSTGRRIVTPSDDPVNAARALVVSEAKDINTQFATNQGNAKDALGLEEAQMSNLGDLLGRVRQLAVQGGDGALSPTDLQSIATELRSRFDELLGIANTTDANGDFIFAGYMGNTKPFGGNVDAILAGSPNGLTYSGDSGQRQLQVSATRFLGTSDSGSDIFTQIKNGNGTFVTDYNRGNAAAVPPKPANSGTAVIDAGSVTDTAAWNAAMANPAWAAQVPPALANNVEIRFWEETDTTKPIIPAPAFPAAQYAKTGNIFYDVVDSNGISLYTGQQSITPDDPSFTGAPPNSFTHQYHEDQAISLNGLGGVGSYAGFPTIDMGANVLISGTPQGTATDTGLTHPLVAVTQDAFKITPSTTQSIFGTIANLIGALENKLKNPTAAASTALANDIGQALTNLDQGIDNVLRVRASIGARLNELDSLSGVNQDLDLRYQATLSNLQDVDYAKTISDLQQNQNNLDAAQKTFTKVTQLSLFNYL